MSVLGEFILGEDILGSGAGGGGGGGLSADATVTVSVSLSAAPNVDYVAAADLTITPTLFAHYAQQFTVSADASLDFETSQVFGDNGEGVDLEIAFGLSAESGAIYVDAETGVDFNVSSSALKDVIGIADLPLIVHFPYFDPNSLQLIDYEYGIDLDAIPHQQSHVSAHIAVSPTLKANAYVLRADAIDATADVSMTFAGHSYWNVTADTEISFPFTIAAAAEVSDSNIDLAVEFELTAGCHVSTTTTATLAFGFDINFAYTLIDGCVTKKYTPFVGATTGAAPPDSLPVTSGDTGFKLIYPSSGMATDTLDLRNPNLGNPHRLQLVRINRESRGGTLVIFADPLWPIVESMVFNFSVLTSTQAYALRDFMRTHLGLSIKLIDHENRAWTGIISDPTQPIVEDHKDSFSASFEFQGERNV